ncbi:BatA domain-containing protein [Hymenobacter sp. BT186]|uniref:BatA domain-containing protein n=1 Tax=Hymenobacter telluris TaxID=2816474 RepID=A0A939EZM5_9BACT|nr:BatA domain-containing protein [Hymenobacter telluris]MBO0360051.1 BatA domain-containing protein [Hymenobacter telluris]MBW3376078.1 BatA domain-containing protein [Hymenobacter norwichensis]
MALTYPWFLLGLVSIAIPIAIHLFELRRPKRILFTNIGFIREVKLISARQRKLKHLLVLLARISFITFLVLIFVQPYIPAPIQNAQAQTSVGVFVDATPSMQASNRNSQPNGFEQSIKQAQELPNAYSTNTAFSLLNSSIQPRTTSAYRLELDKLSISGEADGVGGLLNRISAVKPEQVFVFSDFQKNDFSAKKIASIDSGKQVFLVPVGTADKKNVFVDSVWLDDAFIRSNTNIKLHIRLRNGGNVEVDNCQVKLFVGDRQAAAFRTDVPVGGVATTTVQLRLEGERLSECRVELNDFPVTFDNSFYFALQPSPKIKVLDIAGTTGGADIMRQLYANEPLFAYNSAKASNADYRTLESSDIVIVEGQARIETGLRESLVRVAKRGASLVIVPPSVLTSRSSYNQLFEDLGVGPIQWEPAGLAPVLRDVAVPTAQNPFFKDVFGSQNRQPVMPKASPVIRWSRSDANIVQMRDGEGFLGAFSSGPGRVYLFAAPFSTEYTDFTQHALFVPVMYRLAMQSYRREQQPAYRLNQGTIAANVAEAIQSGGEQVFKLSKDSTTFIPSQRLQAGILRFDVPVAMREPGFYTLSLNGKTVATLAFNFDKRESELATYSAEELRQLVGPNQPNVQVYDGANGESVAAKYKAERVGKPLWYYCLWAALASLLAEVLVLRFMRQQKAQQQTPIAA